jgi:hypothetical protein
MTANPFAAKWAELRRRRRIRWLGFFGWAPIGFVMVQLMELVAGHAFADQYWFVFALPSLLVGFAMMVYGSWLKCPRCDEWFESRALLGPFFTYHNPFTRRCVNCRIKIGTPQGDA